MASGFQDLGNTEISDLDRVVASQKDILGLDIAMDHLAAVDVLKGKSNLNKPIENLKFSENLILTLLALDMESKVTNYMHKWIKTRSLTWLPSQYSITMMS